MNANSPYSSREALDTANDNALNALFQTSGVSVANPTRGFSEGNNGGSKGGEKPASPSGTSTGSKEEEPTEAEKDGAEGGSSFLDSLLGGAGDVSGIATGNALEGALIQQGVNESPDKAPVHAADADRIIGSALAQTLEAHGLKNAEERGAKGGPAKAEDEAEEVKTATENNEKPALPGWMQKISDAGDRLVEAGGNLLGSIFGAVPLEGKALESQVRPMDAPKAEGEKPAADTKKEPAVAPKDVGNAFGARDTAPKAEEKKPEYTDAKPSWLGQTTKSAVEGVAADYVSAARALYEAGQDSRNAKMLEDANQAAYDLAMAVRAQNDEKALDPNADTEYLGVAEKEAKLRGFGDAFGPGVADLMMQRVEEALKEMQDPDADWPEIQRNILKADVIPEETVQGMATEATGEMSGLMHEDAQAALDEAKKIVEDACGDAKYLSAVGKFGTDMVVQAMQMASDAAFNLVAPGMSLAAMGARSFGSAADEAKAAGLDPKQTAEYAAVKGGISILSEQMFGAFSKIYGPGVADDLAEGAVQRIIEKIGAETNGKAAKALTIFLKGGGGEAAEELAEAVAGKFADAAFNVDSQATLAEDMAETGYSMLVAFALGSAGETINVMSDARKGGTEADTETGTQTETRTETRTETETDADVGTGTNTEAETDVNDGNRAEPDDNGRIRTEPDVNERQSGGRSGTFGEETGDPIRESGVNVTPETELTERTNTGRPVSGRNAADMTFDGVNEFEARAQAAETAQETQGAVQGENIPAEAENAAAAAETQAAVNAEQNATQDATNATENDDVLELIREQAEKDAEYNPLTETETETEGTNTQKTSGGRPVSGKTAEEMKFDGVTESEARTQHENEVFDENNKAETQSNIHEALNEEEKAREDLNPENDTHTVHTDEQVNNFAQERISADSEGARTELLNKDPANWNDVDVRTAEILLENEIETARGLKGAEKDKAYRRLAELKDAYNKQGTAAGQALRQRQNLNTGAEIVAEAANTLYGEEMQDRLRDMSPEQKTQIMDDIVDHADTLDAITTPPEGVEPGTAEYSDFEKQMQTDLLEYIKEVAGIRRTTGLLDFGNRKLNWALSRVANMEGGMDFLRQVAAVQTRSIASDYINPGKVNQAKALRYLFALSNPATSSRNVGANTIFGSFVDAVSNNASIPMDSLMSMVTGRKTIAFEAPSAEAAKGSFEAGLKSWLEVTLDADTGDTTMGYDEIKGRTFKQTGGFVERMLGKWERNLAYQLNTTDQIAKGGIEAETNRSLQRRVNEGNMTAEDAATAAKDEALYRSLQNSNPVTELFVKGREVANNLFHVGNEKTGTFGLGDQLLPFAQVPANAVKTQLDVNPMTGTVRALGKVFGVMSKGENATISEQRAAAKACGQAMNGTAIVATAAAMAAKGLIRNPDDDKDLAAVEKANGISGTQINISAAARWMSGGSADVQDDDTWVDISWVPQLSSLMIMGDMIYRDSQGWDDETGLGQKALDVAGDSFEAVYESIMQFPAISSIANIINAGKYAEIPEGQEDNALPYQMAAAGGQFLSDTVSGFTVPNAVAAAAAGIDDRSRDTYSSDSKLQQSIDYTKSKIPGLRETLPEKLDPFGNPLTSPGGVAGLVDKAILPGSVSKDEKDPFYEQVIAFAQKTGDADIVPDRNAPNYLKGNDGAKIGLKPWEGQDFQKRRGEYTREYYQGAFDSEAFGKLDEKQQTAVLKQLKNYAEEQARTEVLTGRGEDYTMSSTWKALEDKGITDPVAYLVNRELAKDANIDYDPEKETDYAAIDAAAEQYRELSEEAKQAQIKSHPAELETVAAANNGMTSEEYAAQREIYGAQNVPQTLKAGVKTRDENGTMKHGEYTFTADEAEQLVTERIKLETGLGQALDGTEWAEKMDDPEFRKAWGANVTELSKAYSYDKFFRGKADEGYRYDLNGWTKNFLGSKTSDQVAYLAAKSVVDGLDIDFDRYDDIDYGAIDKFFREDYAKLSPQAKDLLVTSNGRIARLATAAAVGMGAEEWAKNNIDTGEEEGMSADEKYEYIKRRDTLADEMYLSYYNSPAYKAVEDTEAGNQTQYEVAEELRKAAKDIALSEYNIGKGNGKEPGTYYNVIHGVNKPGTGNDIPGLNQKNLPEFVAFKVQLKNALKDGDYTEADRLMGEFDRLNKNTQDVALARVEDAKNIYEYHRLGLATSDYAAVKAGINGAQVELDVTQPTGGKVRMLGLLEADVSDAVREKLVQEGDYLTKNVKATYNLLKSHGYDLQNVYDLFYGSDMTDGKQDGKLTNLEAAEMINRMPELSGAEKTAVYNGLKEIFNQPFALNDWKKYTFQSELSYLQSPKNKKKIGTNAGPVYRGGKTGYNPTSYLIQ